MAAPPSATPSLRGRVGAPQPPTVDRRSPLRTIESSELNFGILTAVDSFIGSNEHKGMELLKRKHVLNHLFNSSAVYLVPLLEAKARLALKTGQEGSVNARWFVLMLPPHLRTNACLLQKKMDAVPLKGKAVGSAEQ